MIVNYPTWVLTLSMGMGVAIPAVAQEPPKCRLQQIAEIPVTFRNNKPLVQVTINGR